jgi:hypothetical protein
MAALETIIAQITNLEINNETKTETETENKQIIYTDTEEWKNIEMYGIKFPYQISNHGRVRNIKLQILKQSLRDGYKSVNLTYNKTESKFIKIHRLVAFAFVPNNDPINNNIVNHIDGNKLNNHHSNFEWTTIKANCQHAIDTGLTKITKRRVIQLDKDDIEIEIFESLDMAKQKTGIDDGGIAKVCKGSRKTAGGFKWKYADININEQVLSEEDLEGFVPVKDFPNYIIDKAGRVYSKPYKKFLKLAKTRDNSMELQLTKDGSKKTYLLHNLMAEHFLDEIEEKECVAHINRDKSDNRLVNLVRVSHSELCRMAIAHRNAQSASE